MRKIETEMCNAVLRGRWWHKDNTSVRVVGPPNGRTVEVYLHDNLIATYAWYTNHGWSLRLFDGGWQSATTKSRLNALLQGVGRGEVKHRRIWQKDYVWYYNRSGEVHRFDDEPIYFPAERPHPLGTLGS